MPLLDLLKKADVKKESLSFHETHREAYSHGLEKTYAIETINLNSIRKLNQAPQKPKTSSTYETPSLYFPANHQLEFDFGQGYREWIPPLFLKEPIRSLGLSTPAEKCLEKNGKNKIQNLVSADSHDLVFLKGMGQGLIDEIQQALKSYVNKRSVEKDYTVGWESLIKSLFETFDRKKSYILLEKYELTELLSLTPAENVEVKRLLNETKELWCSETIAFLTSSEKKNAIYQSMGEIVDAFLKPWMMRRGGIATSSELNERLQKVSSIHKYSNSAIQFLNHLYFNDGLCFANYLIEAEANLFCVNKSVRTIYETLISKSDSYFYSPAASYSFPHFLRLLEKEYLMEWNDFPREIMKKMLCASSRFRARKGINNTLKIRRNPNYF